MTPGYYGSSQVMPDLPFIQFQLKTPKCSTRDKIWQQHRWLMKREAHIQIPILCLLAGCLTRWSQKLKPEMSMPFSLDQKLAAKVTSQTACAKLNISGTLTLCVSHIPILGTCPCSPSQSVAQYPVVFTNSWYLLFLHTPYSLCSLSPALMILPLRYLSRLTASFFLSTITIVQAHQVTS